MSVGRVVRHFQSEVKVPIDLEDVLALVREAEPDEDIEIHGVNVSSSKLKGNCYRYKKPPAPGSALMSTRHALITYSNQLDDKERRLVCCKELIHILDPDPVLTKTQAQVITLSDNMASRKLLKSNTGDALQAMLDKLAIWQAASILFPYTFWEDLMPKYKSGRVTSTDISDWLEIPEDFVVEMMKDAWVEFRSWILAYC
jgi:hypothetical protein